MMRGDTMMEKGGNDKEEEGERDTRQREKDDVEGDETMRRSSKTEEGRGEDEERGEKRGRSTGNARRRWIAR